MITLQTMMVMAFLASPPVQYDNWYAGDERCPPPQDDGTYSAPYHAIDHPGDYPTFHGADKPGWSCSYQREDGVIVQYGDNRTPQQQWMDVWGDNGGDNVDLKDN
ncbi:MAG: hypothetical protein WA003_16400 [Desulfuromonadaceae bacterium]